MGHAAAGLGAAYALGAAPVGQGGGRGIARLAHASVVALRARGRRRDGAPWFAQRLWLEVAGRVGVVHLAGFDRDGAGAPTVLAAASSGSSMSNFVELWTYLSATPLFGLTATVLAYVLAYAMYERLGQAPWANPVLWTVVLLVTVLSVTKTAYPVYFSGAQFIHFLLGPAVVALAWPLWERRQLLREHIGPLLLAALCGGAVAAGSAWGLGRALDLPVQVQLSLLPKSVTAPVAMGIADQIGGIAALAAIAAVLTGIIGAISGKYWFDALRIRPFAVRGFALGTASHGIGAARAMQVHPDAGALAGLALALQAVLASLLLPLAIRIFS